MTLADRTIEANRSCQDELAGLVKNMSEQDLTRTSGASEWTVAQVLSHLGSSAEIALEGLRAAQVGEPRSTDGNQAIWDRWNAMSPRAMADGYLDWSEQLVSAYEAFDPEERASFEMPLAFLPAPADLALVAGLRLNEAALHGWDVAVAFDPAATLDADVADVLVELYTGAISFLLGFTGKLDQLDGRTASVLVRTGETTAGLTLEERAALGEAPDAPDTELTVTPEALIRLLAGRLPASHTPSGVEVTGAVSLEDLRRVFPGY
jgi:uncharacterized protein (TIGR03083 family)